MARIATNTRKVASAVWAFVRTRATLYLLLFLALGYTNWSYHKADADVAKSRVAGVSQACAQFNDIQGVLADLVSVSLSAPQRHDLTPAERKKVDKLIARFRHDLKLLAPNDCAGMKRKLEKAISHGRYDRSVPYEPKHPAKR